MELSPLDSPGVNAPEDPKHPMTHYAVEISVFKIIQKQGANIPDQLLCTPQGRAPGFKGQRNWV